MPGSEAHQDLETVRDSLTCKDPPLSWRQPDLAVTMRTSFDYNHSLGDVVGARGIKESNVSEGD